MSLAVVSMASELHLAHQQNLLVSNCCGVEVSRLTGDYRPVALNSVAGLITTLVNVYTAQKGIWSVTAKITAIVTGSCVGAAGSFFAVYHFWALRRVKEAHERDMGLEDHSDEALIDDLKREAPPGARSGV